MTFEIEKNLLDKIAAEPKTSLKLEILKKNKEVLRDVVLYALDFTMKYNIKKFPPEDYLLAEKDKKEPIFKKLRSLADGTGAKKSDILELAELCYDQNDIDVVHRILNKDLRCGINLKTASKVYPELPTKDIMLCGKAARVVVRKGKRKVSPELKEFFEEYGLDNVGVSVKENGVRDKIIVSGNMVKHISRNGIPYTNFGVLDNAILELSQNIAAVTGEQETIIFDGEVISADDDFQNQMTQVRRLTNADPSIFRLRLFDIPSASAWTQRNREHVLKKAIENLSRRSSKLISGVYCARIKDMESFLALYDSVVNSGKEGVVLKNLDGLYEEKRSNNWCKVKTFFSEDLVVLGAEKGKAGKKYGGTLGALIVDFKGVEVRVGSGYTDEERKEFLRNPPKMIEVEYKEITKDGSLFHPTFVRVREDRMV